MVKQFVSYVKKYPVHLLILTTIIFLSALLRLIYLDRIPNGISGDELTYLLTIKAMWLTGHDISGTWNPRSIILFHYPKDQIQAELSYFLYAPIVGFFPFSLLVARITNAMLSIATVLLMYLVAKKLFNDTVGLITAFLSAINPWFIYIGRTAYEVVPALFFFLAFFYILLIARKWKILLSIPFIFLFFYSYIATKIILIPFLLIIIWYIYNHVNNKKDGKYYLSILCITAILTFLYTYIILFHSNVSRVGEILTPMSPQIAEKVDELRKVTIHTPFTEIFINKFTVYTAILFGRLFSVFSFPYLFISGDEFFSIWSHGLFYVLDAVFLVLGFIFLFIKNKRMFYFFLLALFLSTIPHIIHGVSFENFTPHIVLLFPFLIFIIAFAIYSAVIHIRKNMVSKIFLFIIVGVYLVSLGNFINIYFYQFPLHGYFDFNVRVADSYINRAANSGKQIEVYTNHSQDMFGKYLFYENAYTKKDSGKIQRIENTKKYTIYNIHFISCSDNINARKNTIVVFDARCGLLKDNTKLSKIKMLSDGGDVYFIRNDLICRNMQLKNYPSGIQIRDFAVESLSNKQFCATYIFQ